MSSAKSDIQMIEEIKRMLSESQRERKVKERGKPDINVTQYTLIISINRCCSCYSIWKVRRKLGSKVEGEEKSC